MFKYFIVTKIGIKYEVSSLYGKFKPEKNVSDIIFLMEYCKPLNLIESLLEYNSISDKLFHDKSVKELGLNTVKNEFDQDCDNMCILFPQSNSYCFVKMLNFSTEFELYYCNYWLDFHYPVEQFINEKIKHSSLDLDKIVNSLSKLKEKASSFNMLKGSLLNDCLEVTGLKF